MKWANFDQCTRSRSLPRPVDSRSALHAVSLTLVRSVFPPPRGVRLVGVTLSNFTLEQASLDAPDLLAESDAPS